MDVHGVGHIVPGARRDLGVSLQHLQSDMNTSYCYLFVLLFESKQRNDHSCANDLVTVGKNTHSKKYYFYFFHKQPCNDLWMGYLYIHWCYRTSDRGTSVTGTTLTSCSTRRTWAVRWGHPEECRVAFNAEAGPPSNYDSPLLYRHSLKMASVRLPTPELRSVFTMLPQHTLAHESGSTDK